jgi:hypothetical protein
MANMGPDMVVRIQQQRRLAGIQTLSFAASCGTGGFFGTFLIASVSLPWSGVTAIVVGVIAAGLLSWLRHGHPPAVDPSITAEEEEPPTSDTYGWEVGTFLVTVVAVPLIVVAGVVIRFWIPATIIAGFWMTNSDVPGIAVLVAAGCSVAVLACLEFGIEIPLCRHWGLPYGEKTRPLKEYCPPSRN